MLIEQRESKKIDSKEEQENILNKKNFNIDKIEKKPKVKRTKEILLGIIGVLVIIIIILCFRVGKIGYNYLSIWDTKDIAPIVIKTGDLQITTNTSVNIFGDQISPRSKGNFKFLVKNDTNEDVIYHIKFVDEMNNFVNMKYRLKLDNVYVKGNKNEYIKIEDLDLEHIIVPKDSTNIYTLEWYWEDDDKKDTYIGTRKDPQYYTLNLYIYSQAYNKSQGEKIN